MTHDSIGFRLSLAWLLVASLGGCAGAGFDLTIGLAESVVPGNPIGGVLGNVIDVPIPLDVDLAAETAARDTGPAQAVRLADLRLFVTDTEEPPGDTDDLSFVDSAEVFVEASGLPRVRVAEALPPLEGDRALFFQTDPEVNLLPYINAGATLSSEGSGTAPPDDVSFAGTATLSIELL